MTQDITDLLKAVDGSGSDAEQLCLRQLQKLTKTQGAYVCEQLAGQYHRSVNAVARARLVNLAVSAAHCNPAAFELGLSALKDPAQPVRFYACKLLAWAQQQKALFPLKAARDRWQDTPTHTHINAAMDAILHRNPHYFLDHHHTGCIYLRL